MPITLRGYGRASTDKQVLTIEAQRDNTHREFQHQLTTGQIPADSIWGGFFADTDTCRAVPFLKRPMGIHVALNSKPEDRIIVAAYDRMIASSIDCYETIEWAIKSQAYLIFMDLRIDSSTSAGRMALEMIGAVKGYERREISRRTREVLSHKREAGLPDGNAPIGYVTKTIIPVGGKPMKYYMPCPAERRYGQAIVDLKDQHGMSYREIALKFFNAKIPNPRGTRLNCDFVKIGVYYRAAKAGWPLRGGVQWKPPSFKYKFADKKVIDLNRVSA